MRYQPFGVGGERLDPFHLKRHSRSDYSPTQRLLDVGNRPRLTEGHNARTLH
jgi:hypothetical protein